MKKIPFSFLNDDASFDDEIKETHNKRKFSIKNENLMVKLTKTAKPIELILCWSNGNLLIDRKMAMNGFP